MKQVRLRNTLMTARLLVCLNCKVDCELLERVAMRQMANNLTTLVLEDCCIQDEDLAFISGALCRVFGQGTVCKLRCLALTNNFISGKGGQGLGKALGVATTLQHLYLDWNNLGATGCRQVCEALGRGGNKWLQVLHLEANDVRDLGATCLARALETNSTLTVLDLATNNMTHEGAKALAHMLASNSGLVSLCCNGNSIGEEGGCALALALLDGGNSRLQTLELDSSDIGLECYKALSKSLRAGTCGLRTLSASGNACGDAGARAVAYALSCNSTLTCLRLAACGISDQCASAVADVAGSVGCLRELDLRANAGSAPSPLLSLCM